MSDKSQKTEEPTPKKKRDARREGQIARSIELSTWVSMLAASILLRFTGALGATFTREMAARVEHAISKPDTGTALALLGEGLKGSALMLAPLVGGLMVVGLITNFAQVGFAFTGKMMKPKFARLNPIQGTKRLLSPISVWQAAKDLLKVSIMVAIAWPTITGIVSDLVQPGTMSFPAVAAAAGTRSIDLLRNIALAGLVLAAVDFLIQRRKIRNQMKMTKQEIKDEFRQSEGDPLVKSSIRQRQMAMSRNRMMASVATADAVIVNPTHVAVAIRYDAERGAPRVVAKGAGSLATKIREEATGNNVPLVQDVPLARALYRICEIDDEIPTELYEAVAKVLAFVFALRARSGPMSPYRPLTELPDVHKRRRRRGRPVAPKAA